MDVHCLVTGPVQENTYLIRHSSGEAVLVDPGDDADDILEWVRVTNSSVVAIALTHAHFDHIGAVQATRTALQVPVYLHADAWTPFSRAHMAAERFNLPFTQPDPPEHELEPGAVHFGSLEFRALFTPGHAPGHIALYHASGFVISGDALFRGTVGRTDIPGADHALLLERIKRELYTLPDETVVFPGHGASTTIGAERRSNPHTQ
jgi:glyoxylase-like metal-dependent hydrolase (beta-lactamase superfamily II)